MAISYILDISRSLKIPQRSNDLLSKILIFNKLIYPSLSIIFFMGLLIQILWTIKRKKLPRTWHVSQIYFQYTQKFMPGGVSSPVRAYRNVEGPPPFIRSGSGPFIKDEDNNEYIDYVCGYGCNILGHKSIVTLPEICRVDLYDLPFKNSHSYSDKYISTQHMGAPHILETQLAQQINRMAPEVEMLRFVSSGTEACMSVARLMRAATNRPKIIKFAGHYHGHADVFQVQSGSGLIDSSSSGTAPGIPNDINSTTEVAIFNDIKSVENLLSKGNIAGIILEPIGANNKLVKPNLDFLHKLRELCSKYGALLCFDEVITGFRAYKYTAATAYGIIPDLVCLGKTIGGGLPLAAYGGKRELMSMMAPQGEVYQAGTMSGHPVCAALGLNTLKQIHSDSSFHDKLESHTSILCSEIMRKAAQYNISLKTESCGGLFHLDFESPEIFAKWHLRMKAEGILFAPSSEECSFITSAHTKQTLQNTIDKAGIVLESIQRELASNN